jgi:hypothetical protein
VDQFGASRRRQGLEALAAPAHLLEGHIARLVLRATKITARDDLCSSRSISEQEGHLDPLVAPE